MRSIRREAQLHLNAYADVSWASTRHSRQSWHNGVLPEKEHLSRHRRVAVGLLRLAILHYRIIDAGVPLPKVAKIVGWAPATMVRMAARYGHFNLESLRDAVATINRGEIRPESPVNPPVLSGRSEGTIN